MSIVDHIAILVEDLQISQEWYEKTCGARVIYSDYKHIRMTFDNVSIALIDKKHYKYAHIGLYVHNYEDLPSNEGEMVQHRDGTTGCYVKDPDGNVVEFIHYSEKCKKEMKV